MERIGAHSKASIELQIHWKSAEAEHTERYLARKVNIWRDIFPPGLEEGLQGLAAGESVSIDYAPGQALPAYDGALVAAMERRCFAAKPFLGQPVVPRPGRFFPRGCISRGCGCFPSDMRPFRVVDVNSETLTADMNPALADRPFTLTATVQNVQQKHGDTGGHLTHWMEEAFLTGPGMQARRGGQPTQFGPPEPLERPDAGDDSFFYAAPRLVGHVDAQASAYLRKEYAALLQPGDRVLDLMSSLQSHLPANHGYSVAGLGMNSQEMAANPALDEHLVHDLNAVPRLPFADATFDAVLCSLSIEYLTEPSKVINEAARIITPGGRIAISFSNRWFPQKASRLWTELHEFERMGWVLDLLLRTGAFTQLQTLSIRNWWRPEDDPHIRETWISDPVYLVSGVKK